MAAKTGSYNYQIPVQYLQEGGCVVAVCPVLDVSSYGKTLEEAHTNFKHALNAFFSETTEHHTIDEVLKGHGWEKIEVHNKPRWNPPVLIRSDYEKVSIPA